MSVSLGIFGIIQDSRLIHSGAVSILGYTASAPSITNKKYYFPLNMHNSIRNASMIELLWTWLRNSCTQPASCAHSIELECSIKWFLSLISRLPMVKGLTGSSLVAQSLKEVEIILNGHPSITSAVLISLFGGKHCNICFQMNNSCYHLALGY